MVTVWLAALLNAAPGNAASPGRAAFEKASRLFKEGAYEEALPYFRMAYRLSERRPSTIYGLAQCERSLGRLEDAAAHLEEFIRVAPEDQVDQARRVLAAVRRELPPGASAAGSEVSGGPPPPPPGISVSSPPPPSEPAPTTAAEVLEKEEEGGFWTHPAPWIVVGAVAIAGAVTAGWLLTRDNDLQGGSSGVVFEP